MSGYSEFLLATQESARALVEQLKVNQTDRLVMAESCTAGLASGLLAQVPGVSQWLCGSAVTYRESVKVDWLGVSAATLASHFAESMETTSEMALGVLGQTAEASCSVAITGHLGPDAPPETDGHIFIAVAMRTGQETRICSTHRLKLHSLERVARQYESANCVLRFAREALASGIPD